jgi:D-alanyl-D-alanine carboxypeptidase
MSTDTQFLIASVTKTLTAAAVLKLVEQGRLDLDAPMADFLPSNLAVDTNGATVIDALRMQTGLADADEKPFLQQAVAHPEEPIDPASLLEAMPSPKTEPGRVTDYVDANYMLLGYVIERASGTTVAQAFRTLVLADPALARLVYQDEEQPQGPLALGNLDLTYYTTPGLQESLRDSLTSGYIPSRALAPRASTADAAVSDSPTLARWGYLLFGGYVVDDASLARMTDFAAGEIKYGMGAHDLAWPAGLHGVGHNGWDLGYVATLLTRPESAVTVAALTNDQQLQGFWPVADQLADLAESCGG